MAFYPESNNKVDSNYVPPASIKRKSTKDDVIKNLQTLFDATFEENMKGMSEHYVISPKELKEAINKCKESCEKDIRDNCCGCLWFDKDTGERHCTVTQDM